MPLLSLSLNNFRNLENKTIDLLSKEVYFVGENGQGKSNLLEAIYMSSYGNSFKTHSDSEIVKFGESNYFIKSFFREENGISHTINTYYDSSKNIKKIIEKNGKKIKDKKEIINTIPCVLFSRFLKLFKLKDKRGKYYSICIGMMIWKKSET